VSVKLKYGAALILAIGLLHSLPKTSALAITAELARKCQALVDQAYPLRVPGNPAGGRTRGTARDLINYYNKCVANDGDMTGQPAAVQGSPSSAPAPGPDTGGQTPK
jgi:hypothetical protein